MDSPSRTETSKLVKEAQHYVEKIFSPRLLVKEAETHHGRDAVHGVHLEELRGFVLARHDVAHDQLVLDSVLLAETCAQTPISPAQTPILFQRT